MTAGKTFNSIEQAVYDTAREQGADDFFARLVLSQMKHESANFTSNVFKKNLNPMGMKMPSKRKSPYIAGKGTQPPGNEGATPYARFNSVQDAVRDLFHWLSYNKLDWKGITSIEEYAEALRRRSYMGNTEAGKRIYIAGLSRWMKSISGTVSGTSPLLLLLFLIGIIFLLTIK